MRARIVCLTLLAMWALLGVYMQMTNAFGEGGGGRFACVGLLGLAVVVAGTVIEASTTRERHAEEQARGQASFSARRPSVDYASPSRPPSAARPDRGSLPSLLGGIGIAALLLASMVHLASEGGAVAAGVEVGLVVLGVSLTALAAVLVLRRRR